MTLMYQRWIVIGLHPPKNDPRDSDSTKNYIPFKASLQLDFPTVRVSNSAFLQEMDRLDQRCHTEAIELRAQLSAAQARFKATKVERERLRKARGLFRSGGWNSKGAVTAVG